MTRDARKVPWDSLLGLHTNVNVERSPTKKEINKNMSLKWCNETENAIAQFMSDSNRDVDFCIFVLENKNNMNLHASGKGGRQRVSEILNNNDCDDKVMVGAFLALAIDERGSVVSTRQKYIHFLWVGPNVGVMVKGRVNSLSGAFRDKFPACVIYLQLMADLDQLEEQVLEKNLLACGGAHKPSRYDFTNAALENVAVSTEKEVSKKESEPVKEATKETKVPETVKKVEPMEKPAEKAPELVLTGRTAEVAKEDVSSEATKEPVCTPTTDCKDSLSSEQEELAPDIAAATDSEGEEEPAQPTGDEGIAVTA